MCSSRGSRPVRIISSPGVQEATARPRQQTHVVNFVAEYGIFIRQLFHVSASGRIAPSRKDVSTANARAPPARLMQHRGRSMSISETEWWPDVIASRPAAPVMVRAREPGISVFEFNTRLNRLHPVHRILLPWLLRFALSVASFYEVGGRVFIAHPALADEMGPAQLLRFQFPRGHEP